MENKDKFKIILCGYTKNTNTCYYPWKKFYEILKGHHDLDVQWTEIARMQPTNKRRVFICWNEPDARDLVERKIYRDGDIILQKIVGAGKRDKDFSWGANPAEDLKSWTWNSYTEVGKLFDQGVNIHVFGCRTDPELFPEKKRVYDKMKDRWHWIPWGSSLYDYNEIQTCKPIMEDFKYDVGFVGSRWGKVGRGNVDSWQQFMEPLLKEAGSSYLAGRIGQPNGPADDPKHKQILKSSRLCPIINAPIWRVEMGMQDRFWTVFTSGRFGVVDTEGAYLFFNEDEVVCATDPEEYLEKSLYYMKNIDAQKPFIEKVQKRIREEYNYYTTWGNIMKRVMSEP